MRKNCPETAHKPKELNIVTRLTALLQKYLVRYDIFDL